MENVNPNHTLTPNNAAVQHVTKASSDQLLSKFAELGSESDKKSTLNKELALAKRRKQRGKFDHGVGRESLNGVSAPALVERKSLLQPMNPMGSKSLTRRFGIGKVKIRAKELKNKSFIGTIEKTWRRTIEGASKIFVEKHYKRHKRLISEVY
ncbi:hypothetical protein Leryth_012248 [Lithospermum erythrorhizon]|nr:hypothetical protein Leryth_012248 [Lithospermum erythrorhizon]